MSPSESRAAKLLPHTVVLAPVACSNLAQANDAEHHELKSKYTPKPKVKYKVLTIVNRKKQVASN